MKALKSLVLSMVTAATTLGFVVISAPAQACLSCNGLKLNGPVLNGIQFNGPVFQGPVLQGPIVQGPILQGPVLQGPVLQGPVIQGPLLQWSLHVGAATAQAQAQVVATGPVRVGQPVAVTLASGRTLKVK